MFASNMQLDRKNSVRFKVPDTENVKYLQVAAAINTCYGKEKIHGLQRISRTGFVLSFKLPAFAISAIENGLLFNSQKLTVEPVEDIANTIWLLDAPLEITNEVIQQAMSRYGKVEDVVMAKIPEEYGGYFNGDRKIRMQQEKQIPNFLMLGKYTVRIRYPGLTQVCRRCEKPGHFARECTGKIECRQCGKEGHLTTRCFRHPDNYEPRENMEISGTTALASGSNWADQRQQKNTERKNGDASEGNESSDEEGNREDRERTDSDSSEGNRSSEEDENSKYRDDNEVIEERQSPEPPLLANAAEILNEELISTPERALTDKEIAQGKAKNNISGISLPVQIALQEGIVFKKSAMTRRSPIRNPEETGSENMTNRNVVSSAIKRLRREEITTKQIESMSAEEREKEILRRKEITKQAILSELRKEGKFIVAENIYQSRAYREADAEFRPIACSPGGTWLKPPVSQ